ncbi:MAG: DNA adenine methylase [Verrucomicrobia bacterium]|nr:DNA adenine methylase [Verrucomicrobiota bacterium]
MVNHQPPTPGTRTRRSCRRRRLAAFPYYGGKFVHLNFILPLLPTRYRHFCEPFGGSAAVLLNRPPAPIETYNDLDSEVVNFFACLREQPKDLIRLLHHTPYSREELLVACHGDNALPSIERARRFYVRLHQTFNAVPRVREHNSWSYARETSRRGMSALVSKWQNRIEHLPDVIERFRRVQIEHAPAIEVIRRFDSTDTLFYCDPPYPHESRRTLGTYAHEMSDRDHEELAAVLHAVRGAVAVSGYRCPLMDRLYGDWRHVDAPPKRCNASGNLRRESVWMNYDGRCAHTGRTAPLKLGLSTARSGLPPA